MTKKLIPTYKLAKSVSMHPTDAVKRLEEKGIKPVYESPGAGGRVARIWDEKQAREALVEWQAEMIAMRNAAKKDEAPPAAAVEDGAAAQLATMVILMTELLKNQKELAATLAAMREEHAALTSNVTDLMSTITAPEPEQGHEIRG